MYPGSCLTPDVTLIIHTKTGLLVLNFDMYEAFVHIDLFNGV